MRISMKKGQHFGTLGSFFLPGVSLWEALGVILAACGFQGSVRKALGGPGWSFNGLWVALGSLLGVTLAPLGGLSCDIGH